MRRSPYQNPSRPPPWWPAVPSATTAGPPSKGKGSNVRRKNSILISGQCALYATRMAGENPSWGEERIANDLVLKLGLRLSPRTVRKYSRHAWIAIVNTVCHSNASGP